MGKNQMFDRGDVFSKLASGNEAASKKRVKKEIYRASQARREDISCGFEVISGVI